MNLVDRIARSAAFDVLSRRDGLGGWKRHRDAFRADAAASADELRVRAQERLSAMLAHAATTSRFHRAAWRELGFSTQPPTPGDLVRLPFLTKDVLRAHRADLISERFSEADLTLSYTGGTTGTQTAFYLDRECFVARNGRQWGVLERCGYSPGMRRGLVWGVHSDLPANGGRRSAKQWFRDYASGHEVLCCTVMRPEEMLAYHARLVKFAPHVLYGYPSALVQLGNFIEERGLARVRVASIITTAERLGAAQRRRLSQMFDGEVFNLYCSREHGCVAFECAAHDGLHIDTGSVHLEILRDGRPVPDGEVGEITITDLQNRGMPFIRSRTGDLAAFAKGPCSCGLPFPRLQRLDGRSTDRIHLPNGAMVPGLMLADLFMNMPSIRFAQFIQEKPGHIEVQVVVTPEFDADHERQALAETTELLGHEIRIELRRVPEITRSTRSGKLREVICMLDASPPEDEE